MTEKTEDGLHLEAYAKNIRQRLKNKPVTLITLLRIVAREGRDLDCLSQPKTDDIREILLLATFREIQAYQEKDPNQNGNNGSPMDYVLKKGIEHGYGKRKALSSNGTEPIAEDLLPFQIGGFTFEPLPRLLRRPDGADVRLSPRLASLFSVCANNPHRLVTLRMISRVWGLENNPYTDSESFHELCREYTSSLRRAIGDEVIQQNTLPRHFRYINTILLRGIIFDPEGKGKTESVPWK